MQSSLLSSSQAKILLATVGACAIAAFMTACNKQTSTIDLTKIQVQGGVKAVVAIDQLLQKNVINRLPRKGALLGVYVAQYLSQAILHPVHAAIAGVEAQGIIANATTPATSGPDFALLQNFGELLSLDVSDMLNRSIDRQGALDAYLSNLNAIGKQSNDRYTILLSQLKDLGTQKRTADRANSDLKKAVQAAIKAKDFTLAGEQQALQTDSEKNVSDINANLLKTQNVVSSYNTLLTLFGQRSVAIDKNRELLISGLKAVDIPGVDMLNIIQREKGGVTRKTGTSVGGFSLFDFSQLYEGLQ